MSDGGAVVPPEQEPPVQAMPQGPPVFQLATWIQRVFGFLVDAGIVWGIVVVGGFMAGDSSLIYSLFVLGSLVFWAWNMYTQGQTGQSIGKRVAGLRLVSEANAEPIGGVMSVGRSVLHVLDSICYVGFLWPLWDAKRQTFADKIIRSVVITTR